MDETMKISNYVKEELPTWDEVYSEFYKKQLFIKENMDNYSIIDPYHRVPSKIDPYYKLPKGEIIVALVCNQFNKMITENKGTVYHVFFNDWRFILIDDNHDKENYSDEEYESFRNAIYTIPHPTGKVNPFINDCKWRIDITSIENKKMMMYNIRTNLIYKINPIIINWFMEPFTQYFEEFN